MQISIGCKTDIISEATADIGNSFIMHEDCKAIEVSIYYKINFYILIYETEWGRLKYKREC